MIKEIFPEGQTIFKNRPHTTEFLTLTLDEIDKAGESFIGIIRVDEPEAAYFLFFLSGDAYAAGYIMDGKPMPLSIKDFLQHMSGIKKQRTISLYKTDPVLLKGMLVFLQREPSIKATTNMIDLDSILIQIKNEKAAAFVILKKDDMHNFFYFHSGELKIAHFADKQEMRLGIDSRREGSSIVEQMLLYAYPPDKTQVEAMIYRDIKTSEASDISEIKPFLIADALLNERKEIIKPSPAVPLGVELQRSAEIKVGIESDREEKPLRVRIVVTEGPQRGNKFNVPLPCTIGRRDADIRIRDMTVSKRHASIEASGKQIIFKDLDSTNGSMVNGKEVKETELSDGDIVQMGNTSLKIHFVSN